MVKPIKTISIHVKYNENNKRIDDSKTDYDEEMNHKNIVKYDE